MISDIESIIKKYKIVSKKYGKDYFEKYGVDYNKMIKQKMDFDLIEKALEEVDIFSEYINKISFNKGYMIKLKASF